MVLKCCLQNVYMAADYFSDELLIGSQFMTPHIKSICRTGQPVEFLKCNVPILESTPNNSTIEGLESIEEDYTGPATDLQSKTMDSHASDVMRHKDAFCKLITLFTCRLFLVKIITKISRLINTKPKKILQRKRCVGPNCEIHKVVTNNPFKVLLFQFFSIAMQLCNKVVLGYATNCRELPVAPALEPQR